MQIAIHTIRVLLAALAIQLAITLLTWGYAVSDGVLDAANGQHTIFETEAKIVVYKTPLIAQRSSQQQVIILGASNASLGLRPKELSPLLNGTPVHNLAIGGQNLLSLCQLVDLIYQQTPVKNRENLVFVAGIWHGSMVDDSRRWPDGLTDVDRELLRYGVFAQDSSGAVTARVPDRLLSPSLVATWPFMLPVSTKSRLARAWMPGHLPPGVVGQWYPAEEVRNEMVSSAERQTQQINSIASYLGPPEQRTDEGFHQLCKLAQRISENGGKLVVLDLPITQWHREASEPFGWYQARMKDCAARLEKIPGASYHNMQDGFRDEEFFDGTHPKPRNTPEWAQRAAVPINAELHPSETVLR
jgi:hypothetical protein